MRKTRSGANFSPYEGPPSSTQRLVCLAAESSTAFLEAANREEAFHGEGLPASERFASPSPAAAPLPPLPASLPPPSPRLSPNPTIMSNNPYAAIIGPPTNPPSKPLPARSNDKNAGKKRRRSEKRRAAAALREASSPLRGTPVKPSTARRYGTNEQVAAPLCLEDMPHAAGGSWIGLRKGQSSATPLSRSGISWKKEVPTLEELMDTGRFEYIPYQPGKNLFFVDNEDRVVASLLDRPPGESWADACIEAARCLRAVHDVGLEIGAFGEADMSTRRGDFLQVPVGPSMGGGQQHPTNLYSSHPRRHQVNQAILQNRAIQRIAGVQSSAFAFTSPLLYAHYCEELQPVFDHDPQLIQNFPNSVFPAVSFNCGAQSTSLAHFDFNNLSFGQCTLTPVGDFDHRLGGHMVLYTLGKIVEFPWGTTFTLPSAAYEHGNTRLPPLQTRQSIAQYAAGGLFRWRAYGFRTAHALSKTPSGRAYLRAVDQGVDERWRNGLMLYSTVESLPLDYAALKKKLNPDM